MLRHLYVLIVGICAVTVCSSLSGGEGWETKRIHNRFYSEGASAGDIDGDGHVDIVAGPLWFRGPEFREMFEIAAAREFPVARYSDQFFSHVLDANNDGANDVLVLGFPGDGARLYLNPGKPKASQHWPVQKVTAGVDNESPRIADLIPGGLPEIICGHGSYNGYYVAGKDATKPWMWVPVSEAKISSKFTHGLGVGDVNLDGRLDILDRTFWWEQPEKIEPGIEWKKHQWATENYGRGGAQIFVTDVDGDGDSDIISSLNGHGYGLAWFEQVEKNKFVRRDIMGGKPTDFDCGVAISQLHAVDVLDMDGDGIKDIVTGKRWMAHNGKDPGASDAPVVYWFQCVRGLEGVRFVPHMIDDNSGVGVDVLVTDLNGDKKFDVVSANKKGLSVHLRTDGGESATASPPSDKKKETQSLFDGKTLDGWQFDPAHWRVENGAIVGEIPKGQTLRKNTWIIWDGQLRDFELNLQFKLRGAPNANSGIQIRAQARDTGHVSGYQADLDMGATWLGRIYDEHGRALLVERGQKVMIDKSGKRVAKTFSPANLYTPIFRENAWNDYRIIAIGEMIAIYINGTLFSVLVDEEEKAKDLFGKLAFQLHSGPETRVEFRDIQLETLSFDDNRLANITADEKTENEQPQKTDVGMLPLGADGKPLNLDFEQGDLSDWTATGDAFEGQPVAKDTISQRWSGQDSNKQGQYFVGGYELTNSDKGAGTLTSSWFEANASFASFLIAGGSSDATRVDVLVKDEKTGDSKVITKASGDQREQMRRVVVDLRQHKGRKIAVRLVDESSGSWGHLNFDDFRLHKESPKFLATASSSIKNPLLHHLRPNPKSDDSSPAGKTVATMSLPEGFEVDVIAAEPQLHQPMAFTFDSKGRIWIVEGHCYPTRRKPGEGLDKILIFEDADKDGSYEIRKVFAEKLNLVSGIAIGHGGVWVGAAPYLYFYADKNQDDIPDGEPEVLLDGFGYGDTHETLNSFIWGPDGWLYGNQGVFNNSRVGKPGTPNDERIHFAAAVWRYHPTRHEFEIFSYGGSNQWGLDFNDLGQLFMTHCRSAHGRGPTTHVIQGGHYWNQINARYAPFISRGGIAKKNYLLASARYGHGEGGAGKKGSRALYGGHSHVGTMVYLGDNWPAKYRNHLFTHNLHGHRINHQANRRDGSSFDTVHAGYDMLHCSDKQYIGVDLQYGPDGAVYINDWYDPRHCHTPNTDAWDRGNGRLYRMSYEGYTPANVNYGEASDLELVETQLHVNDWHVRMARLILAERATSREIDPAAVTKLLKMATEHEESTRRLRAVWCLHVINRLDRETVGALLSDESEYVRAWAVQLLAETDALEGRGALIASLLGVEESSVVKLYLASAAGRMQDETAWRIIETLCSQPENAEDRMLPLLMWHTLAQFMSNDLPRAISLYDTSKVSLIGEFILWYAPQISEEGRDLITARIGKASGAERHLPTRLFAEGMKSARNLKPPNGWAELYGELRKDNATKAAAESLGAVFGVAELYKEARMQLSDDSTGIRTKLDALRLLANNSSPENLPVLLASLDVPELRLDVIRQIKSYNDPKVSAALVKRIPNLPDAQRDVAMETICSRAPWSLDLLDAIKAGNIDDSLLTAFYVRQMANIGNPELNTRLKEQWGGSLGTSSDETKAAIKDLVAKYNEAPHWAYKRSAGEVHFRKLCATCHTKTETSDRIGPKLEGTGSKGIEYIVENILDPNAVVGKDFQSRSIITLDGLVVAGIVLKETETTIVIRTASSVETIAKNDIDEVSISPNSFMPAGLLEKLSDRERIELLMYLMSLK